MINGKAAIVTGASRGIGLSIARSFLSAGASVLITYNSASPARIEELKESLASVEGKVFFLRCDVSDAAQTREMADYALSVLGKIDILVNNAGVTKDNLILRMSEEEFDLVLKTNLKGAFNACKAVAPAMAKQRSGRMINISSIVGLSGNAGQVNYAASKAGLIGLTKSLAKELGSRGVTVNAIAPGFIETAMTDALGEDARAKMKERISLKRFGTGEDVAGAALFFASDLAGYITGEVLRVDGGTSF